MEHRTQIRHEIQVGQEYTDARTEETHELVFLDDGHALLKSTEDQSAILLTRKDFERNVGANRFKVNGDVVETDQFSYTEIDFTDIDGVGNIAAQSLKTSGYSTVEDIERASTNELLACRGIGQGNLSNIMDYIEAL